MGLSCAGREASGSTSLTAGCPRYDMRQTHSLLALVDGLRYGHYEMKRVVTFLGAGLVAGALAAAGTGSCEFTLQREGGAWPALAGAATIWPAGVPPEQARLEVVTAAGTVGCRAVWARSGEPMTILFDTSSGAASYTVRVSRACVPTPDWTPGAGLLLETRSRAEGPVDTLAQLQNLWLQASNTFGRSMVANIYDGLHRHGRPGNFLSRYSGWFQAPKDGRYEFAIVADNASFLLIDSRPVAEWPGWHGVEGGRRGQHGGAIELTAGLHQLEFWNVQNAPGFSISLAWQLPGETRLTVMPAAAFVPVASFRVAGVQNEPLPAALAWEVVQHAQAGEEILIGLRFRALTSGDGVGCLWRFDDGTEHAGAEYVHVFSREGLRHVELVLRRQGEVIGVLPQEVSVHPNWLQLAEFPEQAYDSLRDGARQEALSRMAPADLAGFVRMAQKVEDWTFLRELAEVVYNRRAVFTNALASTLHTLGFYYQRPGVMQYERAATAWRAVLADPSAEAGLRAATAVQLAGLLLRSGTEVAEAQRLLVESAPNEQLSWADRRLKTIFRADALVLQGQREAALACYRQAGTAVAGNDTDYEVRRRGRIENARDYLRRKEWDAAEKVVRGLEWEWPWERLELETGMLLAEVHRGRGEYLLALGICRRLLAAAPADVRRSDLLLVAAQVCHDLKRDNDCQALLAQLRKEHPYSEAAALAKDRFPR